MLYMIGIGLSFFLTFLLVTKKEKTRADKILSAWLFMMALHLVFFYLRITSQWPILLGAEIPLPLLHGPMLYLYTTALIAPSNRKRYPVVHFIPAIACMLYLIPYFMLPSEQKIYITEHNGVGYELFDSIKFFTIVVSGFSYVIASWLALRKYRQSIPYQFSSTEKINLTWLLYLIYGLGLIWLVVLVPDEKVLFTVVVAFVFFIGYFGIRQVGIFTTGSLPVSPLSEIPIQEKQEEKIEKQKYQKSGLTDELAADLRRRLASVMEQEKLFTKSDLTLQELAARMDTLPNHLSQLLNDLEGKTFYDYVNQLRVEEFKRLVATPNSQKLTIMGLASNSGFHSKSSFNRYFKKVTGLSPSEYLKSVGEMRSAD